MYHCFTTNLSRLIAGQLNTLGEEKTESEQVKSPTENKDQRLDMHVIFNCAVNT
jgi:hypothetical protein